MTIEELRDRLTEISDRLGELDTEFQGKRFSEEAKTEWNALRAERDDVTETVQELERRHTDLERIAQSEVAGVREPGGAHFNVRVKQGEGDIFDLAGYRSRSSGPEDESALLRDGAMRALESAVIPHKMAEKRDAKGHVERLLDEHSDQDGGALARRILATGSPTYKRAFSKALVGQPLNDSESRALSLTSSAGGYAVPFTLDPTIIPTSNGSVNPLRQISRVETISTNEWKGVTSAGITASYSAEGVEVTDNSPTLGQPTATPERATAFVPYSIEIGGDWVGLQASLAKAFQDAKDTLEADKFVLGAGHGSNEPEGIITGATGTVAAGSAAFAVANLYSLQAGLAPRFEPNAQFLAHNVIYNLIRQFDTQGGAALWEFLGAGNPAQLLGYPAHKASAMDSVLTNGSEIMVFGDFQHFLIVDRLGMNVELISHMFGTTANLPTGQRGALAIWRNTSDVLSTAAFKVLKTSA